MWSVCLRVDRIFGFYVEGVMPEPKKARLDVQATDEHFHHVLSEFSDVQEKLQQLTAQMSEEGLHVVRQVCQQYNALRAPHYASRAAVLKKLPKFWSSVLLNHPLLSPVLTTDDAEILESLTDVLVKEYEDMQCGFKLEFSFKENPFFEELQLSKTVTFSNEGNMIVDGTAPTWKEHMGPGGEEDAEGSKRKSSRSYNFFFWFAESGTMEPGIQDDMSVLFKDDIWPDPMRYYVRPDTDKEEAPEAMAPAEMEVVLDDGVDQAVCEPSSFPQTVDFLPGESMHKLPEQEEEPRDTLDWDN